MLVCSCTNCMMSPAADTLSPCTSGTWASPQGFLRLHRVNMWWSMKTAHYEAVWCPAAERIPVTSDCKHSHDMICSVNVYLSVQVDSPGEDWRCLEGKITPEHSCADSGQTLLLSEQKCGPQVSEQKLQAAQDRSQVSFCSAASPVDYSSVSELRLWHLVTSAVRQDAGSAHGDTSALCRPKKDWRMFVHFTYRCMFTQEAGPGALRLVWTMFLLWAAESREEEMLPV